MGYVKAVTRKIKKSGKSPIEIRITINRIARYVTLGIDIEPRYWDIKIIGLENLMKTQLE